MGQAFYHALKSGIDFGTMYLFAHLLKMVFPLIIVAVIYLIYRRYHPKKATKLVTLEDMSFLKKWKVLTNDQIDARYILTPVFMEKIKEINRLFKGNAVDFSFFGGKLLIAIHTNKDLFETTSIFSESTDYRRVEDVVEQIYGIFAMVDLLKQQIK